jgi:outer membrane protein assembly factor BamB
MSAVATCYDAQDGREYWRERLGGKMSGSPIAAGGLAYFTNEDGTTIVIEPGPELKIVAENSISPGKGEVFRASPTPAGGQIFLRSTAALYCVGKN